jgi:hypothetical protein
VLELLGPVRLLLQLEAEAVQVLQAQDLAQD